MKPFIGVIILVILFTALFVKASIEVGALNAFAIFGIIVLIVSIIMIALHLIIPK